MNRQTLRQRKVASSSENQTSPTSEIVRRKRRRREHQMVNYQKSWPLIVSMLAGWLFLLHKWPGEHSIERHLKKDASFHEKLRGIRHSKINVSGDNNRNENSRTRSGNTSSDQGTRKRIQVPLHHGHEKSKAEDRKKNIAYQKKIGNQMSEMCPEGILNDNYCDCPDGSDEPDTAACSHLLVQKRTFRCADGSIFIFPSRVKDGVIDCPDGSDES
eukprot:532752_1